MKIVTHKFRIKEDQVCYLVNLVDYNGHPLESHVAMNNKEKSEISEDLAVQHNVNVVYHNSGFSIIE
mgnify:FL=1|jgi:hypothetical protein|tara:strand:- start:1945 stop:2145 length:201 start_codon:yes stop_codon:yes gene_type:complete